MSVMHPKHGEGTVVSMTGRGPKCTATIRFDDGETKSFRVAFADLRPIV
jgi:DNA helicase-2/ATP-dependent DNA helicase PcrA